MICKYCTGEVDTKTMICPYCGRAVESNEEMYGYNPNFNNSTYRNIGGYNNGNAPDDLKDYNKEATVAFIFSIFAVYTSMFFVGILFAVISLSICSKISKKGNVEKSKISKLIVPAKFMNWISIGVSVTVIILIFFTGGLKG